MYSEIDIAEQESYLLAGSKTCCNFIDPALLIEEIIPITTKLILGPVELFIPYFVVAQ